MRVLLPVAALAMLLVEPVAAVNRVRITPREMMAAIKRAGRAELDGVDPAKVTIRSVRVVRCIGPDEEPTEFECRWQTRDKGVWKTHKSWLAIDRKGWHFIG